MHIVADENIPLLDEFFAAFGSIRRLPGRSITAADVREADLLLVRSVTPVNRALLDGSRVRFVGTCTIGTDHLDLDYFAEAGIAWSSAPGCNARGVVDYVLGSVLTLATIAATALLLLGRKGPDGLDEAQFASVASAHKALIIAAAALCVSAMFDLLVFLDFEWAHGENVAALVSNANLFGLLLIGLMAAMAGKSKASQAAAEPPAEVPPVPRPSTSALLQATKAPNNSVAATPRQQV